MARSIKAKVIDSGEVSFSIESRILRELGERLVKKPEVALLELIKNSYDADATECLVDTLDRSALIVSDNGHGMTFKSFKTSWMRVGTSSKSNTATTSLYGRAVTGEKGIGRFAVRFLGEELKLTSIAYDHERGEKTKLTVKFSWPKVDENEDLGQAAVPYELEAVDDDLPTGTQLEIRKLRNDSDKIDWRQVRTGAIGVVSPLASLLSATAYSGTQSKRLSHTDPGLDLRIQSQTEDAEEEDLAEQILDNYVLRGTLELKKNRLKICVYEPGANAPYLQIEDTYSSGIGTVRADIRFFPRRKGTFDNAPVDGRKAYGWIKENSGIAVFDRGFRVLPYGTENDDWLQLAADAARNRRDPRSSISNKNFPMSVQERASTQDNWMLRLPQPAQLVGVVRVTGVRSSDPQAEGLVASADREGFVENDAFAQLFDVVRGVAELIAVSDRRIQRREEERQYAENLRHARETTQAAIEDIQSNKDIPTAQKQKIVSMLVDSQNRIEAQELRSTQREEQLQIVSLLGIVAGYMTHEFGVALTDLEAAKALLTKLASKDKKFQKELDSLSSHIDRLTDFSRYSRAYIEGTRRMKTERFSVRPRINQVLGLLGDYAEERGIFVDVNVDKSLKSPALPAALYNGILQNLFTNAMKAISTKRGTSDATIAIRAWNDPKWHYLQVSDTGVGIPSALEDLVFDPLFSTTDMAADPLGSGMGLGLSLVRKGAEAFGGKVDLMPPPPGFSTCFQVRFPITEEV